MRHPLPFFKSLAVWLGLFALAVWSWPMAPASPGIATGTGGALGYPVNAVPTVAQSTQTPVPTPAPIPQDGASATTPAPLPPPSPTAGLPSLPDQQPFSPYVPWPTARLRIHVIDGRTEQPLQGAEVVVIETEQRLVTGKDGFTPWIDAPIIRNPRYRPMVAELHGQLGAIVYKNGYRDSIHLGIRMHDGMRSESTVWMYKLGPGDTRIEPVLYQVPYHHIWLVELADKFRSKSQPGEGPEQP